MSDITAVTQADALQAVLRQLPRPKPRRSIGPGGLRPKNGNVLKEPGIWNSYEHLFHEAGLPKFWLDFHGNGELARALRRMSLERAIGVIYRPKSERRSHYFQASLSQQFDLVIHVDETNAVFPLKPHPVLPMMGTLRKLFLRDNDLDCRRCKSRTDGRGGLLKALERGDMSPLSTGEACLPF